MSVTSLGTYKQDELPVDIEFTFRDSTGVGIDLTGYTVKGVATGPDGVDATTQTGSLDDAANGVARMPWHATWTAAVGPWHLVIWAGDGTTNLASATVLYSITYATAPALP